MPYRRVSPCVAVALLLLSLNGAASAPVDQHGAAPASPEPSLELLARAKAILESAPLIDGHNDLATRLLTDGKGDLSAVDLTRVQPAYPADLPRLRAGGVGAQFWSAYVDPIYIRRGGSLREALRQIDILRQVFDRYPDLELALTATDIERRGAGHIASLIGVEGGHAIENSLAALRLFHHLGVRYLTLTHWDSTEWADAATDRAVHRGLTEFGEDVVREMNRVGMFVDLAHVSDETMRDVLRVSRAPVIFSHANARAVAEHPRNVPDDILRRLPANGGVIMVNFIASYVAPGRATWEAQRADAAERIRAETDGHSNVATRIADWERANPAPRGTVADVADHIDHLKAIVGIDHVGIGSDFYNDGNSSMAAGLENPSRFPYLFAELLRRGYSESELKKIAGQNLLRAMREMERVASALQAERSPSTAALDETRD